MREVNKVSVAYYIVLEQAVKNLDTFVDGKMLAKLDDKILNERAKELNVKPLPEFFGADTSEFFDENDVDFYNIGEKWFLAAEGLESISVLLGDITENPEKYHSDTEVTEGAIYDLEVMQSILLEAEKSGTRWHLSIDF